MASTALASSVIPTGNQRLLISTPGCRLKLSTKSLVKFGSTNLSWGPLYVKKVKFAKSKRHATARASYRDEGGRSSHASVFVGGFILGGFIMGTLGCVFSPQISKALAWSYSSDLKKMLPKFLYDEEKALELNDAIDTISSQLKREDAPNGAVVAFDEMEAAV